MTPLKNASLQARAPAFPADGKMGLFKKFVLWNYSRETTVYVLFCLLIVAFIFLTPKAWFERREQFATQTSRLIVQTKDFSTDSGILAKRVRELSGRPDAEIVAWREKQNAAGETFYEIDIR